jgi:hypothetical protein
MCLVRGDALRSKQDLVMLWLHEMRNAICNSLMSPSDLLLCRKHIAACWSRIFEPQDSGASQRLSKENFIKAKVPSIQDASILRDVQGIQFAAVPLHLAKSVFSQCLLEEENLDDDEHQKEIIVKQGVQYIMVKKGGPWLLDLKSKLFEMSNADDCKLLQVQSEQSLLLILDIHRFLAKIPANLRLRCWCRSSTRRCCCNVLRLSLHAGRDIKSGFGDRGEGDRLWQSGVDASGKSASAEYLDCARTHGGERPADAVIWLDTLASHGEPNPPNNWCDMLSHCTGLRC